MAGFGKVSASVSPRATHSTTKSLGADEAKFALHSRVVDYGVVLSSPADSRRTVANESGSHIGFPNVA